MNEMPVVHLMIICENVSEDPQKPDRLNAEGLMFRLRSPEGIFPTICSQLAVFVALRNGRGAADGRIACVHEETGITVWQTVSHHLDFGDDPLEFKGDFYRVRNSLFPVPGVYVFEFRYNGDVLSALPLFVEGQRI